LFHCGSVSLSLQPCRDAQLEAARRARAGGALVSFDPNWRPSLWDDHEEAKQLIWDMMPLCDIVKVADEEWEFLTGTSDLEEGAQKIRACGPRIVVVTRGEVGAWFQTAHGSGEAAGLKVQAVDTLGAGDAFVAGLLSEILRAPSFDEWLQSGVAGSVRFANACGAFATQKPGAIPSLPTREEAQKLLA
jgi:fructokinase